VRELAPGLWHWTAFREAIGAQVSSYYLSAERVMIDPMIPPEGVEWLEEHGPPVDLVLSNRHHDRDAWKLREAFGSTVWCVRNGLHELEGRGPVEPFEFGDELPGRIVAYEVDAICPDETALYVPAHRALACADGVVHAAGGLSFVPDFLMDEPDATKRGLRDSYRRLLELDFDLLLLAHGEPLASGGRDGLREFATA
jgi:glyoxylase-like metal-dependent hydrolase (beta-lactamase superfamily II)